MQKTTSLKKLHHAKNYIMQKTTSCKKLHHAKNYIIQKTTSCKKLQHSKTTSMILITEKEIIYNSNSGVHDINHLYISILYTRKHFLM